MLPGIGIPTTAGTGSEAQTAALISDPQTHRKMACNDPKAAFRIAILDPLLTLTLPQTVTAEAGYDAITHAVESFVTRVRNPISDLFARDAWRRLESNYETALASPDDVEARSQMLLGAWQAGVAIEQSMLGAAHACANPLTARYGTTHAVALSVMSPHVVRWNTATVGERYAELLEVTGHDVSPDSAGAALATRLEALAVAGGLPTTLDAVGARREDLDWLAEHAETQWTGTFNPRPVDRNAAYALYEGAFGG